MKSIGIIAALGRELREIRNGIEITNQKVIKGYKFSEGNINNNRIILTSCSVGKVNAAICTELLITNFDVDYVINTGIAGSLNPEVRLLDIVAASDIMYHDIEPYILNGCFPFQDKFISSKQLLEVAQNVARSFSFENENRFHVGRIVSGDAFVSSRDQKKAIADKYSPLCVEMEGAAIAHTCYINDVPFLIIRAISDDAGQNAHEIYKENEIIAANQAGKYILELLKSRTIKKNV